MSREEEERVRQLQVDCRRRALIGGKDYRTAQSKLFRYYEGRLDLGRGSCPLQAPEIAQVVVQALSHFAGDRYDLGAWCLMPNHVHVIVSPNGERLLSSVLGSWKSYTAKQINGILGKTGTFWQGESFDHLIRSATQHEGFERYILDNPRMAGIQDWPWVSVLGQTTI